MKFVHVQTLKKTTYSVQSERQMEANKHYRPKKFIGTLLIVGIYKFKGEPVSQLCTLSDGRPIFNTTFARTRFQEILGIMRFDDAVAKRQKEISMQTTTNQKSI